jgi:hypothetical protein
MIKFSLSRVKHKVVPESMVLPDGREVAVNADFRVILKCLRTLKNRDFTDAQKEAFIALYFFGGINVPNPSHLLGEFLSDGESSEENEPVLDFEQDADAIFSSFYKEYGIDLIDIPFLHWNKFKALMAGLGTDTAIGNRVNIRTMSTDKMPPEQRAKVEKLKRSVQLNVMPFSAEEERLQNAVNEALIKGIDPANAIKELKEYYNRVGGE